MFFPTQPYSPDFAPCDFSCSQNLKNPSKEEDLRRFRRLNKCVEGVESHHKKWKHRCDKCVRLGGEYFEGGPNM